MATPPDSDAARNKWDARYRDNDSKSNTVAAVLTHNQQLLPKNGRALDIATGFGGNALFLAKAGLQVDAWDISPVAIAKLKAGAEQQGIVVSAMVRDIIAQPPQEESYDVIVVSRFLKRELCPAISAALKPGGLLFYQTYMQDKKGDVGPTNPRFLLKDGELPLLFSALEMIIYEEGDEAMFVGRKGAS